MFKKITLFFVPLCILIFTLSGCSSNDSGENTIKFQDTGKRVEVKTNIVSQTYRVLKDPESKCLYLVNLGSGASPYFGEDGKVKGCSKE